MERRDGSLTRHRGAQQRRYGRSIGWDIDIGVQRL